MRLLLVIMALGGVSMIAWGLVGLCRLLDERTRGLGRRWLALAIAPLASCAIALVLLAVLVNVLLWLSGPILGPRELEQLMSSGAGNAVTAAAVALCGAAGGYFGARLFGLRKRHFAAAMVSFGVLYALAIASLPSLVPAHVGGSSWGGLTLIAFTAGSCGLGLAGALLPRRRPEPRKMTGGDVASRRLTPDEVAVVVCAHNEGKTIGLTLDAIAKVVSISNVFVSSDGSSDDTVPIARRSGCNVLDIQPNGGKANALKAAIDHFRICDRFSAALILDADTEIDPHYLEHALPLFDDPEVAAVAGHAVPNWHAHRVPEWGMFFLAYRTRLYRVTQALLRYGQTWKHSNVHFIVPGFASMYRCSALPSIDIDAPGLILEDFNMTFEVHHKRLGKIAYSPRAQCVSQEIRSLRDYYKQVRRWYLGFWQTVRRHGLWFGLFWVSLGVFVVEMLLQSIAFLALPLVLAWFALQSGDPFAMWLPQYGTIEVSLLDVATGVLLADYALTLLVAAVERKPILAFYGLGFLLLRWVDSFLFLYTLPLAFVTKSDGRWVSPTRFLLEEGERCSK